MGITRHDAVRLKHEIDGYRLALVSTIGRERADEEYQRCRAQSRGSMAKLAELMLDVCHVHDAYS